MKKVSLCFFLFFVIVSLCSAEAIAEHAIQGNNKAEFSYALGMIFASDIKQANMEVDYSAFLRGFREMAEDQQTRYTLDEAIERVDVAVREVMAEKAEANLRQENEFLQENAKRDGVYTTASGLQYEILREGTGEQPGLLDYVRVDYVGYLPDGTVFDSSYEWGEPAEFPLQAVIVGWSEGLRLMHEGGKSRLFIPSSLGYGTQGAGNVIPPNSLIIFEVELLEILGDSTPDFFLYAE